MVSIEELYRKWAPNYDNSFFRGTAVEGQHGVDVLELLKAGKEDVVLDLGCGTGKFTLPLADRVSKVYGLDLSKEMLQKAKIKSQGYSNIELVRSNVLNGLPFSEESFDKILCMLVANHVNDLRPLYNEAYRVLKPEGIFLIDDVVVKHSPGSFKYQKTVDFSGLVGENRDKLIHNHRLADHIKTAEAAGFQKKAVIPVFIDEKIKNYFTPECYERYKGEFFAYILSLTKAKEK